MRKRACLKITAVEERIVTSIFARDVIFLRQKFLKTQIVCNNHLI
ncbi:hypothetical protein [Coxiella burnetii]|uniref:Uncharacterized protein n=1 Tax=Coxiella burnetii (strain RSA 493 / Nine Mile phase I) TaxID=227377 RepID=Q83DS1_COXBU|nr:hypothetical protein [Coxiella burnetii]NP_819654.1 hypothetical protein CBU_0624 [Coxiella burnetii RSA 493]AAO90168.1 hypothetical protein CBU_0624 [Coxiella burnetii RSA 493]AML48952.1 hypothetical protein AUR58_07000 [Coxiella burnetii]AML54903.1 hypothetical protein AYM38_06240 [Coxiella burnetii]ARI65490.1 hypothetical protein B7L74_03225 [Coxiella burnetii]ARK26972.1 hypothetical protein BMW92_03135 [Coxiella burnetii]